MLIISFAASGEVENYDFSGSSDSVQVMVNGVTYILHSPAVITKFDWQISWAYEVSILEGNFTDLSGAKVSFPRDTKFKMSRYQFNKYKANNIFQKQFSSGEVYAVKDVLESLQPPAAQSSDCPAAGEYRIKDTIFALLKSGKIDTSSLLVDSEDGKSIAIQENTIISVVNNKDEDYCYFQIVKFLPGVKESSGIYQAVFLTSPKNLETDNLLSPMIEEKDKTSILVGSICELVDGEISYSAVSNDGNIPLNEPFKIVKDNGNDSFLISWQGKKDVLVSKDDLRKAKNSGDLVLITNATIKENLKLLTDKEVMPNEHTCKDTDKMIIAQTYVWRSCEKTTHCIMIRS